MARSVLDGATHDGALEAWFNLEDHSGNQGIAERVKILKMTNHHLKRIKVAPSSIVK